MNCTGEAVSCPEIQRRQESGEKMKVLTYQVDEKERVGFLSADGQWIYMIESLGMEYRDMKELIRGISPSEIQLAEYMAKKAPYEISEARAIPVSDVKILAPIPAPDQDVICLGVNYMEHLKESDTFLKGAIKAEQAYPVYFGKRVGRAAADGEAVPSYPGLVEGVDYEVELAVIIGKDARDVTEDRVQDYIFGYTILNDVSARNLQDNHKQWYFGKSLDGYTPMGPWIVTANEFEFPPRRAIQSYINGELRQNANTEDLIFGIPHIVSELSRGMTLKAGTIISTGTPAGAGVGFHPPKYLKSGDVMECRIDGIGTLTNRIN